jgi:o-succinylbenzoate synthase
MMLKASWQPYTLQFKFDAGTSRGVLRQKNTWYLLLNDTNRPGITGIGECGPLAGLSPDDRPDFEQHLTALCYTLNKLELPEHVEPEQLARELVPAEFPAIRFGLETALYDLLQGGTRIIFNNSFSQGKQAIPINGLIWMGDKAFMLKQIQEKLAQGYSCIKIKIGAIDFEEECRLLAYIRERFSASEITLRVDANGAFSPQKAQQYLERLAHYDLHSIEQPIKAGQWTQMNVLCAQTPLPIALDEELIGINNIEEKAELLDTINPQYIILKPTLVGGMGGCREWIHLAEARNIPWWITSALESNIGLNAISQFTAEFSPVLPQGLGTGQLYHNNIAAPLQISGGELHYNASQGWDLSPIAQ